MKRLASVKKLNEILRAQLITQSGVNGQLVRDSLTEYGAYLDKNSQDSVFISIQPTDVVILFELRTRDSTANVSFTKDDDKIIYDRAYQLHVMLYGDASTDTVNTLIARLRTEKVRSDLYSEGVYVEKISDSTEIHEFKNNVVWLRNDFDIDVCCEIEVSQVVKEDEFAAFDKIIIQRS